MNSIKFFRIQEKEHMVISMNEKSWEIIDEIITFIHDSIALKKTATITLERPITDEILTETPD